jgi:hypothetical protein
MRERFSYLEIDRERERREASDTIADLRNRLDQSEQERRDVNRQLTALLTDQRQKPAAEPEAPAPRGFRASGVSCIVSKADRPVRPIRFSACRDRQRRRSRPQPPGAHPWGPVIQKIEQLAIFRPRDIAVQDCGHFRPEIRMDGCVFEQNRTGHDLPPRVLFSLSGGFPRFEVFQRRVDLRLSFEQPGFSIHRHGESVGCFPSSSRVAGRDRFWNCNSQRLTASIRPGTQRS